MRNIKLTLSFLLCILASSLFAQTLLVPGGTATGIGSSDNGNIGIGTSKYPDKKLTVYGSVRLGSEGVGGAVARNGILIGTNGSRTELRWQHFGHGSSPYFAVDPAVNANRLIIGTSGADRIILDHVGNMGLGIGTGTPSARLHVSSPNYTAFKVVRNSAGGGGVAINMVNGSNQQWDVSVSYNGKYQIKEAGAAESQFSIEPNGNVGIGTTSPGSYKLAVEGKIGAREVNVTTAAWADFVFADDYVLRPLEEVEQYIRQNKHLPDVPSEAEVLEKGIDVGAMNAKLLQKIEELTLYTIQQEKAARERDALIHQLVKRIEELESSLQK